MLDPSEVCILSLQMSVYEEQELRIKYGMENALSHFFIQSSSFISS